MCKSSCDPLELSHKPRLSICVQVHSHSGTSLEHKLQHTQRRCGWTKGLFLPAKICYERVHCLNKWRHCSASGLARKWGLKPYRRRKHSATGEKGGFFHTGCNSYLDTIGIQWHIRLQLQNSYRWPEARWHLLTGTKIPRHHLGKLGCSRWHIRHACSDS